MLQTFLLEILTRSLLCQVKLMLSEIMEFFNFFLTQPKDGQLGDLTQIQRTTPVLVSGIYNVDIVKVSGGELYSVMLNKQGKIFGFGKTSV
jgi:hypothetical protein